MGNDYDAQTACLLRYQAELDYARATDPAQSALTASFPLLVVVFTAYLAAKISGI